MYIIFILIILLLLYYLVTKYKDIECFNVGSQCRNFVKSCVETGIAECDRSWTKIIGGANVKCSKTFFNAACTPSTDSCDSSCQCSPPPPPPSPLPCSDCIDCKNHGIASGTKNVHKNNCSCTCNDGWTGTNCETPPKVTILPAKINRLPWLEVDPKKNDGYISIHLDKSYTSRLNFTTGPECGSYINPIDDYKKVYASNYGKVLYNLAQFGFKKISFGIEDQNPKIYTYEISIEMNLTNDNIPKGIHWYKSHIFEFKFYVRTFFSKKDFKNKILCDKQVLSLRVTKVLQTKTIEFTGLVDFDVGSSESCPKLNHSNSPATQEKICQTVDFCKFTHNKIIPNSCDNMCSNDINILETVLYLELYRIDIKLIQM